jgi:hypothetical protein
MVNITTDCFNIGEERPYQLNGRLGEPQTLSGSFGGGGKSPTSAGIQTPDPPASSLTAIQSTMLRLHIKSDKHKDHFCELVILHLSLAFMNTHITLQPITLFFQR